MREGFKKTVAFIAWLAAILGGFASFLTWLGIKPKDLAITQTITIANALWLLLSVVLFTIGIGGSVWAGIVQHIEIRKLQSRLAIQAGGGITVIGGRANQEVLPEQAEVLRKYLFTPLQIEAILLAEDLRQFMLKIGKQPDAPPGSDFDAIYQNASSGEGYKWIVKMQAEYESEYSPRVNAFISKLEKEKGHLNLRLRNYKDHVHDFNNINTIRAQLWLEALHSVDIDFAGEI